MIRLFCEDTVYACCDCSSRALNASSSLSVPVCARKARRTRQWDTSAGMDSTPWRQNTVMCGEQTCSTSQYVCGEAQDQEVYTLKQSQAYYLLCLQRLVGNYVHVHAYNRIDSE